MKAQDPFCRERFGGWTCTRREGHDGEHAAHGPDSTIPLATWDTAGNVTVNPHDPWLQDHFSASAPSGSAPAFPDADTGTGSRS